MTDRPICDGCKEYADQCDCKLQSTVARVLAKPVDPSRDRNNLADLHADIAVLKSRLVDAVALLRQLRRCVCGKPDSEPLTEGTAAVARELVAMLDRWR